VQQIQKSKLKCPFCGSSRVYKDGTRPAPLNAVNRDPIQRYRCTDYGHRWSDSPVLNTLNDNNGSGQICDHPGKVSKNLTATQKTKICVDKEKTPTANEIAAAPHIERLMIQLKNDGKTKGTIRNVKKYLQILLANGADLFDPENTKAALADAAMQKNTKRLIVSILNVWFEYNNIFWKPPTYNKDNEIPYIPTEEELDELIAGLGKKCGTFCQILKDTGARSGEIAQLKWSDLDFKQRTINIKAEKHSNGRVLPLTDKTLNMLSDIPREKNRETVFSSITSMRSCFTISRRRLTKKLSNPNIKKIHFHTFRHWKATHDLHLFHDRERVQIILGHKNSNSTETYVHIDKMLYLSRRSDEFVCKVADELDEAIKLIESGFEYHTEIAGHKIFRKRK